MVIKITEQLGEEISEMSIDEMIDIQGDEYFLIAINYNYEEHRWNDTAQFILRRDRDNTLWHLLYDYAKTEEQESGFMYNVPQLEEVDQELIETFVYKVKK